MAVPLLCDLVPPKFVPVQLQNKNSPFDLRENVSRTEAVVFCAVVIYSAELVKGREWKLCCSGRFSRISKGFEPAVTRSGDSCLIGRPHAHVSSQEGTPATPVLLTGFLFRTDFCEAFLTPECESI